MGERQKMSYQLKVSTKEVRWAQLILEVASNYNLREAGRKRSTIGLRASTKERIDRCRAPGQCYDGFIQQMVEYWEKNKNTK